MAEWRLFPEGTVPEYSTPEWYADRERAPHLEQPGHRGRLELAASYVVDAVGLGARAVIDLGAGDGGLLSLLDKRVRNLGATRLRGYDLQSSNVIPAIGERCVDVELRDVVADPLTWEWGDEPACAIATEMLEHLVDPHRFVRDLPAKYLVASSPAYETAESHYAFHLWAFDKDGYAELVRQGGYSVLFHEITGDFQVLLAQRL